MLAESVNSPPCTSHGASGSSESVATDPTSAHYRTMPDTTVSIGIGPFKVTMTWAEFVALKKRFNRNAIFHGPCLIIDRHTGLALDATREPEKGTKPVLWTPHAAPWQQWRLQIIGRGLIRIVSEPTKLVLTATERPDDWSPVWLDQQSEKAQQWRLKKSDDNVAFVIEHSRSSHVLDAGTDAKNLD